MASALQSVQRPASFSHQTVTVARPAVGSALIVPSSPGGILDFAFDPAKATVTRDHNSLVFDLDDGGEVTILNFFAVGENPLPELRLPDGTVVQPTDFFSGRDLDMTTGRDVNAEGSGTEYDDNSGQLLTGVDRLGMLGTSYWSRSAGRGEEPQGIGGPLADFRHDPRFTPISEPDPVLSVSFGARSVNESEEGFSATFSFDKPVDGGEVRIVLGLDNSAATIWDGTAAHQYQADAFLPGTRFDASGQVDPASIRFLDGGSYSTSAEGLTYTYIPGKDGAAGRIEISGQGDLFTQQPGAPDQDEYSLQVVFPLGDDHLSEGTETLRFTLRSVFLANGETSGSGVDRGIGSSVELSILDDILAPTASLHGIGEKDGPVLRVEADTRDPVNESPLGGEAAIRFSVHLGDPHNSDPASRDYRGYYGDGLLSQTMTVTLNVSGSATEGEDYSFSGSLNALTQVPGVISASYENGSIILELRGLVDAGPGQPAFRAGTPLELVAELLNDTITERGPETIILELDAARTHGNEVSVDGRAAQGVIQEDEQELLNGPVLALSGQTRVTESANATDHPAHNTAAYTISALDDQGAAMPLSEDVRVKLTLSGINAQTILGENTDTPGADFAFSGSLTATINGVEQALTRAAPSYQAWLDSYGTDAVYDYYYDSQTGECWLTLPAGSEKIDFLVDIVDDLRENSEDGDNGSEGVHVALDLVRVTAEGAVSAEGLPDGEARLGADSADTLIEPDIRPGRFDGDTGNGSHLNPDNFDGPFVGITRADEDDCKVYEGRRAGFTLHLTDPVDGTPYTGADLEEPVTVTLRVDFGGTLQPHDFVFYVPGIGGQTSPIQWPQVYYLLTTDELGQDRDFWIDLDGDLVQVTFSKINGVWGFEFPREFDLDNPDGTVSFSLEIGDDKYGLGVDQTASMPEGMVVSDLPEEPFTVRIVGLTGNEARVNTAHTEASCRIIDDASTAHDAVDALDGPVVSVIMAAGSPDVLYEGQPDSDGNLENLFSLAFYFEQPTPFHLPMGGMLPEGLSITLTPTGSATYGADYEYDQNSIKNLADVPGIREIMLSQDGTIRIDLYGMTDMVRGGGIMPFDMSNASLLTLQIQVRINSDGGQTPGEGAETISFAIDTVGCESRPGGSAVFTVREDPTFSLAIAATPQNEEGVISLRVWSSDPLAADVDFSVTISPTGEAVLWDGQPGHLYQSDFFLPGTGFDAVTGAVDLSSITYEGDRYSTTENGITYTYIPGDGDTPPQVQVSGSAAAFYDAQGYFDSLVLEFPLNDDHISEPDRESVGFTLTGNSLTNTHVTGETGDIHQDETPRTGSIADDRLPQDLDGPRIFVSCGEDVREPAEGEEAGITFTVSLMDAGEIDGYGGYPGDLPQDRKHLSQDMTLILQVDGTAGADESGVKTPYVSDDGKSAGFIDANGNLLDYSLDLSAVNAMPGASASFFIRNGQLQIEISLNGRLDADGVKHTEQGRELFDLSASQGQLHFEAHVLPDDITEYAPESIIIRATSVTGNEALLGGGQAESHILPGPNDGPVISLTGPEEVAESASERFHPAHNKAEYTISLDVPPENKVRIKVGIDGLDSSSVEGTNLNAPGADFACQGGFIVTFANGQSRELGNAAPSYDAWLASYDTPAPYDYYYDAGSKEWCLTLPKNTVTVSFTVDIVDDLRETTDLPGEGVLVTLSLVETDGATDAWVRLGEQNRVETEIVPDLRPAAPTGSDPDPDYLTRLSGHLHPENFDGPLVALNSDADNVLEGGRAGFTLALGNTGLASSTEEAVSVTLRLDFGGSLQPHDFVFYTDADCLNPAANLLDTADLTPGAIYWMDLGPGGIVAVTFSQVNGAWGFQFERTFPAGTDLATASQSFSLEIRDDHYGGDCSITDLPEEGIRLRIVGLSGNEARVYGGALSHDAFATTVITDDSLAAANLDGPVVELTCAASSLYEADPDGHAFRIGLSFKDPTDTTLDYAGFDGALSPTPVLAEKMILTMTVSNGTAVAGEDYRLDCGLLDALQADGKLDYSISIQGGVSTVTITLYGAADLPDDKTAFALADLADVAVLAQVLVNTDRTASGGGASAETFRVELTEVDGNESRLGAPAAITQDLTIEADPVLSLSLSDDWFNESDGEFILTLTFDKPISTAKGVFVTAEIVIENEAYLNGYDGIERFRADFGLPEDSNVTYTYDPATGVLTLANLPAALFTNGTTLDLTFPIIDDHIENEISADVDFTLRSVTITDGRGGDAANTGTVGYDTATQTLTITDDPYFADDNAISEHNEKDGPIVNLSATSAREDEGSLTFTVHLNDPHSTNQAGAYTGFEADNTLSQDMTIDLVVSGNAGQTPAGTTLRISADGQSAGYVDGNGNWVDYYLDLSGLNAIDGVSAVFSIDAVTQGLHITLHLTGRVDIDGIPHPVGTDVFNVAQSLEVPACLIDNAVTDRDNREIVIEIVEASGNEAAPGAGATGVILPDTIGHFGGPRLVLDGAPEVTESLHTAAHPDPPGAPSHNTAAYTLCLTEKGSADTLMAGAEDIRVQITVDGRGALAVVGDNADSPGADFYLTTGPLKTYDADGVLLPASQWLTIAPDKATYDQGNYNGYLGPILNSGSTRLMYLTVPAGVAKVDFDLGIVDDLREDPNRVIDVLMDLVTTDNLPDGEASLDLADAVVYTRIVADARAGALNPDVFDGPYVKLTASSASAAEGGKAEFCLTLGDPADKNTPYTTGQLEESIAVTMRVDFDATLQPHDFVFYTASGAAYTPANDILSMADMQGKTLYVQIADGEYVPVTAVSDTDGDGFTFACAIRPEAGGTAETRDFCLEIRDDHFGGSIEAADNDTPEEIINLRIVGLAGNEARCDATDGDDRAAPVTITDDCLADGNLDGISVGLVWSGAEADASSAGVPNTTTVNVHPTDTGGTGGTGVLFEGKTYPIGLAFFDNSGNPLTSGNNPYAGYFGNGSEQLPENLAITLNLAGNADSADISLLLSPELIAAISNGQVSITCAGLTLDAATPLADLQGVALEPGEFIVTLHGGSSASGLAALADAVIFHAVVTPDNTSETDNLTDYISRTDETFSLTVTGVTGAEALVAASCSSLTAEISDAADGIATLQVQGYDPLDAAWTFGLAVSYADHEKVSDPGEPMHFRLRFTDSEAMQHGEEYEVSACSLFLSLNEGRDLSAVSGATGVLPTEAQYAAWVSSLGADPLGAAQSTGLVVVTGADVWIPVGTLDMTLYDLYVPKEDLCGNALTFCVEQGIHRGVGPDQAGFRVELVQPDASTDPGSPEYYDIKAEVVQVVNNTAIVGPDGITLHLAANTDRIHEDPDAGNSSLAQFHIGFDADSAVPSQGFAAAAAISFQIALRTGGMGRGLDENITDNYLPNSVGDLALAMPDGTELLYGGVNSRIDSGLPCMQEALNDWLRATYGTQGAVPNVSVIVTPGANGEMLFTFTVAEGTPLQDGIDFYVKALDDNLSEPSGGEAFSATLSNAQSHANGTDMVLDLRIGGTSNQAVVSVPDETADNGQGALNGFAIALMPGLGYEGAIDVTLPARAYVTDDNGSRLLGLDDFKALFLTTGGDPDDASALADFITANFGPVQDMTLVYSVTDGSAAEGRDFMPPQGRVTLEPDAWTLMTGADGTVWFEQARAVCLPVINNYIQEGTEEFFVSLTAVDNSHSTGNESRPITRTEAETLCPEGGVEVRAGIIDVFDGPALADFGPLGAPAFLLEPVDLDHTANNGRGENPVAGYEYGVTLSGMTSEPVAVWLTDGGGSAEYGVDYAFGPGVYLFDNGMVYALDGRGNPESAGASLADFWWTAVLGNTDPTPADAVAPDYFVPRADGYFTIIAAMSNSATFTVVVKDDNLRETWEHNGQISTEEIAITICDMQGSETRTTDALGNLVPFDESANFVYTFDGVTGVVTPATAASPARFTTLDGRVYVFGGTDNPDDLLDGRSVPVADHGDSNQAAHSRVEVRDDGYGPQVGVYEPGNDSGTIAWATAGAVDYDAFPNLQIRLQGEVGEPVSLTLRFRDTGAEDPLRGNGEELDTLVFTVTPDCLNDQFNTENALFVLDAASGAYVVSGLPGVGQTIGQIIGGALRDVGWTGGFFLQAAQTQGGEVIPDNKPLFFTSEGAPDHLVIGFSSSAISEGESPGVAGECPEYTVGFRGVESSDDVIELTLTFKEGTAGSEDLKDFSDPVTLCVDPARLPLSGDDFEVRFTQDADGNVSAWFREIGDSAWTQAQDDAVTLSGQLPSALGDAAVEGDETFYTLLATPRSIGVQDAVAQTTVHDATSIDLIALVVDENGDLARYDPAHPPCVPEGGVLTLINRLVLVDANGVPVTEDGAQVTDFGRVENNTYTSGDLVVIAPSVPLTFDVSYGPPADGAAATAGADYSGPGAVNFAGTGEAILEIFMENDRLSEGTEAFTVSMALSDESIENYPAIAVLFPGISGERDENGNLPDDLTVDAKPGFTGYTFQIEDLLNGPEIHWSAADTVKEGGSLSINLTSYVDGMHTVVDEDVTVSFVLADSAGGTDDRGSTTFDDIESMTVGGVTYTRDNPDPSLRLENVLHVDDATGSMTFTAVIKAGEAGSGVKIAFADDVISEGDERFTLQAVSVTGSAAVLADTTVHHIDLIEVVNGPHVGIVAGTGSETDLTASVILTFTDGNPTQETAQVELVLDEASRALLAVEPGQLPGQLPDITLVGLHDGARVLSYDPDTGVVRIELPQGVGGADMRELEVLFPLKDNSGSREDTFTVSLSSNQSSGDPDLTAGELRDCGAPSYTASWAGETSALAGVNGGSSTVNFAADGAIDSVGGLAELALTGFPADVDGGDLILGVTVNGRELSSGDWTVSNGTLVIADLPVSPEYTVTVLYSGDAAVEDAVTRAKGHIGNGSVSFPDNVTSVFLPIANETDPALMDGPALSLSLSLPNNLLIEGQTQDIGVLTLSLPNLPGDVPDTLSEDMCFTLSLPEGVIAITLSANGQSVTYSVDNGGIANNSITVSVGASDSCDFTFANGHIGGQSLDFTLTTTSMDNYLAEDNRPGVIAVTGFGKLPEGGTDPSLYETYKPDLTEHSLPLTDNGRGPIFAVVSALSDMTEGETLHALTVTVNMPEEGNGASMTELQVRLAVTGDAADIALPPSLTALGYVSEYVNGVLTVTIPKGAPITNGNIAVDLLVSMPDDSIINDGDNAHTPLSMRIINLSQDESGPCYESPQHSNLASDPISIADTSVEADKAGPEVSLSMTTVTVSEGAQENFGTLNITLPPDTPALAEDLLVEVAVPPGFTVFTVGDTDYAVRDNGTITVRVPLGSTGDDLCLEILGTPTDDQQTQEPREYDGAFAVTGVSGGADAVAMETRYETYRWDDAPAGKVIVTDKSAPTPSPGGGGGTIIHILPWEENTIVVGRAAAALTAADDTLLSLVAAETPLLIPDQDESSGIWGASSLFSGGAILTGGDSDNGDSDATAVQHEGAATATQHEGAATAAHGGDEAALAAQSHTPHQPGGPDDGVLSAVPAADDDLTARGIHSAPLEAGPGNPLRPGDEDRDDAPDNGNGGNDGNGDSDSDGSGNRDSGGNGDSDHNGNGDSDGGVLSFSGHGFSSSDAAQDADGSVLPDGAADTSPGGEESGGSVAFFTADAIAGKESVTLFFEDIFGEQRGDVLDKLTASTGEGGPLCVSFPPDGNGFDAVTAVFTQNNVLELALRSADGKEEAGGFEQYIRVETVHAFTLGACGVQDDAVAAQAILEQALKDFSN